MRQLASIQTIDSITPMANADSLELAKVLGWYVVVKKDQFKVGDNCVYFEIDSILPERPEFEFLRSKKFKVKTVKLRGQISQGLAFPTSILPEGDYTIGQDVTEVLGVTKYEPPPPNEPGFKGGKQAGNFPPFLVKTDETRVQVLQEIITRYKGTKCFIAEKLDGTSFTAFFKDGQFGVCSRNFEIKEEDGASLYWNISNTLNLREKLTKLGRNLSIQAELVGPGIQGNKYRLQEVRAYFFNVFDIDTRQYLNYKDFLNLCVQLEIYPVPILNTEYNLIDSIDDLITLSIDKSLLNQEVQREGIVIRPLVELQDIDHDGKLHNNRVSFKAINPEFLLKYE